MLWFLLFLIGFFYLLYRISRIEDAIGMRRKYDYEPGKESIVPKPPTQPIFSSPPTPLDDPWASAPPATVVAPSTTSYDSDLEFKLGSKLFTAVGAVAVIFGIGFFLRYAFERDWISESMRVVIGLVSGFVLLGFGEWARKKYATYGHIITGGGLGVLYLSIYAAYNYYFLIPQPVAFLCMMAVTALGVALAVRYDAIPLALFAQIGGFLTPFLLSNNVNNPHGLFIYIIILNIGILAIALWKLWRPLAVVSFVGTVIVYGAWYGQWYDPAQFFVAEFYATIFFLLFLTTSLLQHFIGRAPEDESDLALITAQPLVYYLVSYAMIDRLYPDWTGLFTAVLATLYALLAFLAMESTETSRRLREFFAGIALVLFVIAAPIQFDKEWITMAWAAEGGVLTYLGFTLRSKKMRVFAHGVFLLSFVRLFAFDSHLAFPADAFFNTRVLTYGVSLVFVALATFIYIFRQADIDPEEAQIMSFLPAEILVIFLWLATLEIFDFHQTYWLPIVWSLGALLGGIGSFRLHSIALRGAAYLTFIAVAFRLLFMESAVSIGTYTPLFNTRVFTFLLSILAAGGFLLLLEQERESVSEGERRLAEPLLFLGVNFFLLFLISAELLDYFEKQYRALLAAGGQPNRVTYENLKNVSLSVAWTIYAIALLILGIIGKSVPARFLSIFLFWIVIFKAFIYDTTNLDTFYRFISFITLGIILLLAGYLYNRYRERIAQFIQVDSLTGL